MEELEKGSAAIANGGEATNEVFAHRLPFNVIPHIDKFLGVPSNLIDRPPFPSLLLLQCDKSAHDGLTFSEHAHAHRRPVHERGAQGDVGDP